MWVPAEEGINYSCRYTGDKSEQAVKRTAVAVMAFLPSSCAYALLLRAALSDETFSVSAVLVTQPTSAMPL